MKHCINATVLERIPDSAPGANGHAEELAAGHRAGEHPSAHVHYDFPGAAFIVVAPQGGASA